jgi:hypothetical protein
VVVLVVAVTAQPPRIIDTAHAVARNALVSMGSPSAKNVVRASGNRHTEPGIRAPTSGPGVALPLLAVSKMLRRKNCNTALETFRTHH